ncbi:MULTISPECIES: 16S rRNA (cytosine(1402)-N(4))-methyltransferase RsmH [unclassified Aeromicrobium]|uniref:16S rRNA (cytosine(1402)-N(4))-methyltransferase RsmH n=1 Tax=unclassified Aeromicrobium TaxID=2633570 RepID=UPI002097AFE1|nr:MULTISPECIES: 16S rRNA (cytosine(1402)-N(4))-methyltransferase RsmH [unclassified Aeromicrobium]MCO7240467.1 16S rRNA (cytosine(1402)-N(4))-methyltransferase RsmH [Aeromicrobium sp. CnD17-E]
MGTPDARHVPVLLDRCLELLEPALTAPGERRRVVVDATLGLGGHTEAMLRRFPDVHVVGVDRDTEALARAQARLEPFGDRVTYAHAVYDELPDVLADAGLRRVDGVLFDLGVSSMQLDLADRGFAYAQDAPLDMRMTPGVGPTAADVLNTYPADRLARVLRVHGEEKFARRIADAVVAARETEPFTRSARLVELVRDSIPAAARRTGGHPAKRTFQALRIEVNDELAVYARALPAALDALAVGGRVVVLSYHSLEDRITKRALADVTTLDVPHGLPVVPAGLEPRFRLLTRGAEQASEAEATDNPRARSVRLRAVERVAA